ncbi:unnamed protein product [Pleuronectes platessa]|uniref:Uncharacterized protein n=1 Tax=Pleuronectes platessa TaxID=8262 RepID=A0A9N7VYE1_PLEPL|nr:unnamed protein product [Pleuronectes platessa]
MKSHDEHDFISVSDSAPDAEQTAAQLNVLFTDSSLFTTESQSAWMPPPDVFPVSSIFIQSVVQTQNGLDKKFARFSKLQMIHASKNGIIAKVSENGPRFDDSNHPALSPHVSAEEEEEPAAVRPPARGRILTTGPTLCARSNRQRDSSEWSSERRVGCELRNLTSCQRLRSQQDVLMGQSRAMQTEEVTGKDEEDRARVLKMLLQRQGSTNRVGTVTASCRRDDDTSSSEE